MPDVAPDLVDRLIDLATGFIQNPRLWYAAGLAGAVSASLPFIKQMYGTRQHEASRRHIADHVAAGRISTEEAVALLGEARAGALSAEGFHTAGWVLGPLGAVLAVGGITLGSVLHPGFFAIGFAGGVSIALSFSFLLIAGAKRKRSPDPAPPPPPSTPAPSPALEAERPSRDIEPSAVAPESVER